ncbi:MAG: ATP-grasp domain-containing protein [Pseudomonadales bacterium]
MLKILITSVGSLVGSNILDILEGRRQDLQIIGTNSIAEEAALYRCDKAYFVPPTREQRVKFSNRLLEILEIERPDLIIPARDDDLNILAALKVSRPEFTDCTLCGGGKSVEIITDKWLTYEFATKHNLPFATSAIPNPDSKNSEVKLLTAEYGFPLLAKPRDGFGSHGVFIISNEEQLRFALGIENIVIQQYLSDPENLEGLSSRLQNEGTPLFFSLEESKYSLQTFIHRDGTVGEIFCTQHTMVSGKSLKVEKTTNDALENIALRYAKAMASEGWFGPLNIQCQHQSGKFVAYELNGRFTGATSARYYLGFDEVGNTLSALFGFRLESNRLPASSQVSRYITTLPIPDAAVANILNQRNWQKDTL